jgi:SAM-dependent methyltransferase
MYKGDEGRHYLSIGLSAIRCINTALGHARNDEQVKTILDFPSGYGRVLRFLEVKFPDAALFGSDLDPNAIKFCRKAFHARTSISNEDFSEILLPGPFDLIWCGSLLTHLEARRAIEVLQLFCRHLGPNGLCLFTMHGRTASEWLNNGAETYGLPEIAREKLLSELSDTGYGYADYYPGSRYGISVTTYPHMLDMALAVGDWTLSSFLERAWGGHHDVYGFSKGPRKPPRIIEALGPSKPSQFILEKSGM